MDCFALSFFNHVIKDVHLIRHHSIYQHFKYWMPIYYDDTIANGKTTFPSIILRFKVLSSNNDNKWDQMQN